MLDTRAVYCGDNLEQLANLPDRRVDLIYIDPPLDSNRNFEAFWGETKEKVRLKSTTLPRRRLSNTCGRNASDHTSITKFNCWGSSNE